MTGIGFTLARIDPRHRLVLIMVAVLAILAGFVGACVLVLHNSAKHRVAPPVPTQSAVAAEPAAPGLAPPPASGAASTLGSDLARLNTTPDVNASASSAYPAIGDALRLQPDLYASAFATELLTQDYRTDREALLAWVQFESTPCNEPLVIGLVPPTLRPKLAVFTVSDTTDGSEPPIPSAADWAIWRAHAGRTTAKVTHVTEPATWADAVAAGRITDPGVAARDVDAIVTTQWTEAGHVRTAKRMVTVGLTLEQRPDGRGYGFVNVATYTTNPIGS